MRIVQYLDFRKNPYGLDNLPYNELDNEAREYLENAHACFGTPLERLQFMNMPAYDLYLSKGVDLEKEMLEIAEIDLNEFYKLYGKEKINTAVHYAKDLKDRYTVLWLYYDLFGVENEID